MYKTRKQEENIQQTQSTRWPLLYRSSFCENLICICFARESSTVGRYSSSSNVIPVVTVVPSTLAIVSTKLLYNLGSEMLKIGIIHQSIMLNVMTNMYNVRAAGLSLASALARAGNSP